MTDDERHEIVVAALAAEYRTIWEWEPTPIMVSFGPNNIGQIEKFARDVRAMRQANVDALKCLPEDELLKIKAFKREPTNMSIWPWGKFLPESPIHYINTIPDPLAYGFGHPSFAPDFDYWSLMPQLSLLEATLLSVGAEPEFMSSDNLYKLKKERPKKLWAALKFLIKRHDLLFRVFPTGPMGKMDMSTMRLYGWLKETGLDVHPSFKASLENRFETTPSSSPPKETTNSEKASMLKLIAAMAIEQYSYDPAAARNEAVPNISDDLDRLGISLDLKTIRKWLKEACDLIEPENLPK